MRGFGVPQAKLITEVIIEDVASKLGLDPYVIRLRNLANEGDATPVGQKLVNSTLRRCWDECEAKSDYTSRKQIIEKFNK
jgi:xanthine dehydrogenase molybdopterin-binding subunit B